MANVDSPPERNAATTRRSVIGGVGVTFLSAVAGCLNNESTAAPDPTAIDEQQACDNCGMGIGNRPGPSGQAHYADPETVLDENRPAQFCSTLCTYAFTFDNESTSEPLGTYVTDYSKAEYDVESNDGSSTITKHLAVDLFEPPSDLTLVVDSDVEGSMGASIIPFSESDDADEFRSEYGGELYDHDEITREVVMSMM